MGVHPDRGELSQEEGERGVNEQNVSTHTHTHTHTHHLPIVIQGLRWREGCPS